MSGGGGGSGGGSSDMTGGTSGGTTGGTTEGATGGTTGTTTTTTGGTTSGGGGGGGGGNITIDPWNLGQNYADQTSSVGSTITFKWEQATHGVYHIPSGDCPSTFQNGLNGQEEIHAPAPAPQTVTYTFSKAGTYWFACPVDGHCNAGMKFKVTVS